MTFSVKYLAGAALVGALAAPAAAQTAYPYQSYPQYQQPYAQYPQQTYSQQYGQPNYGYNQGYSQNPVGAIIDSLLGNRYNVSDRTAVSQCATAAMAQANSQYGGYGYNGGYNGPDRNYYNHGASNLRVTAITDVQRRSNGLRVKGLMSSGGDYRGQYGYQNRGYGGGDLSFRCNVDYRGAVTNVRIDRNQAYRR